MNKRAELPDDTCKMLEQTHHRRAGRQRQNILINIQMKNSKKQIKSKYINALKINAGQAFFPCRQGIGKSII